LPAGINGWNSNPDGTGFTEHPTDGDGCKAVSKAPGISAAEDLPGDNWENISLAHVYTFRDGKVTKMLALKTERILCNGRALKIPADEGCCETPFISNSWLGSGS
jgi:hypothetical protein